jgi:4a-hydroxytetrahydrobiopterin dehydratase
MPKLSLTQIKAGLAELPEWNRKGDELIRTFEFKDFPAALRFVNAVGRLAEKHCHHPDIDIRWNKVTLALTTHDEGGLTKKDFDLAKKFDQL